MDAPVACLGKKKILVTGLHVMKSILLVERRVQYQWKRLISYEQRDITVDNETAY